MQTGLSITDLAAEIDRQARSKQDFIAETRTTHLEQMADKLEMALDGQGSFPIQPLAHRQLATFVDVPQRYYDRMLDEAPGLLAKNVNEWLARSEKSRMIRTLDGNVRAYLSNSYQRIDNYDVAKVALPVIRDLPGSRIVSADITDRRLYIHFTIPMLRGEVKKGDVVEGGGIISNSEVGLGSINVSGFWLRLICTNGMKTQDVFRRSHVGRAAESTEVLWQQDTQQADDRAILLKCRDMVKAVTDETRFKQNLRQLQDLTEGKITGNPVKAVEVLANKLDVSEGEKGGILQSLIEGGDLSRWGVVNAITAQAHKAKDYDRAVEFEAMGGKLLELNRDQWNEVLEAA
jgi:hypothetical protein